MADVKAIEFDDGGEPERVTLRLSVEEAAYLAKLTGRQSGISAEEVLPAIGPNANSNIYDTLVGYVFNPYWDGGVDDYLREGHN